MRGRCPSAQPVDGDGSNKAQKAVVNKKAKKKQEDDDDDLVTQ